MGVNWQLLPKLPFSWCLLTSLVYSLVIKVHAHRWFVWVTVPGQSPRFVFEEPARMGALYLRAEGEWSVPASEPGRETRH